jgi:hypothetical protein
MIGEDPFRGSDSPEVIDEPNPHEWVKAQGPDFSDQLVRTKLELTFESGLICGRCYFHPSGATGHHEQGRRRFEVEGPSTRTAIERPDLRLSALGPSLSVESLMAQILSKWPPAVRADRTV